MIASKNAILRYRIIDRCLRSVRYAFPSIEHIRSVIEEELFGTSNGKHICISTLEKDFAAMRREHDAPIKYSKIEKGYYYEDKNYTIEDIPLNDKDIEAIKIAATILNQFKTSPIFRQFDYAISKILDRVNISPNVNDNAVENYVQFEKIKTAKGSEHLEKMLSAIKSKSKIQFFYQSFNATEKKLRRIHPYLLKEYRHRWYLIGKDELKNRTQTYGLDRLSDLQVLSDRFDLDSNFDPDRFFKHSIGITANVGSPEKIIIETEELLSKYLLSQPLHESQEYLGVKNNKHQFSYFLLPTYELKMQLLGFGKEIKIIAPQSLVDDIKATSQSVFEQYD